MSKTALGETNGPSVGGTFVLEKDIFLFETKPGLFINSFIKSLFGIISEVGFGRGLEIRVISFTKNQISLFLSISAFIVSERVRTEEDWLQNDFRALSGGLSGRRTIIVPDGEVFNLVTDLGDTHGLGSQIET